MKTNVIQFELSIQNGHSSEVTALSFSSDGKYFLSASKDGSILLWNADGKLLKDYFFHSTEVLLIRFSRNREGFYSFSVDGTLVYSEIKNRHFRKEKILSSIDAIDIFPDTKRIILSYKNTIYLITENFRILKQFKISEVHQIRSITCSLENDIFSIYSPDNNRIYLLNTEGEILSSFSVERQVKEIRFSYDGIYLACIYELFGLGLYSPEGRLLQEYFLDLSINCIDFASDKKFLLCGGNADSFYMLDLETGDFHSFQTGSHEKRYISKLMFSPGGHIFISGSSDLTMKTWNRPGFLLFEMKAYSKPVHSLCLQDADNFLYLGMEDGCVYIWSSEYKQEKKLQVFGKPIEKICLCEQRIFVYSENKIYLCAISGEIIKTLTVNSRVLSMQRFNYDSKDVLLCLDEEGILTILDPEGNVVDSLYLSKSIMDIQTGTYQGVNTVFFFDNKRRFGYFSDIRKHENYRILYTIPSEVFNNLECISLSPCGTYLVLGCKNGQIQILSIQGEYNKEVYAHKDRISGIQFHPKKNLFFTSSPDRTVKIWRFPSVENVATLFSFYEKEWFIFTPETYFDSSRNAVQAVAAVNGLSAYGVDQFALSHNRPDIILRNLASEDKELIEHLEKQYLKRWKKLGYEIPPEIEKISLPEVKILNRQRLADKGEEGNEKDFQKFLKLRLQFEDKQSILKNYNIYVNDVPVYSEGKPLNMNKYRVTEKIQLSTGNNKIEVSVRNEKGFESLRALTHAHYLGKKKPKLYFMGFGVSEYRNTSEELPNLQFAHKDVLDLQKLFLSMEESYEKVSTLCLINEQVNIRNIKQSKGFLENTDVDDIVILFVSGHGLHAKLKGENDSRYYYLTHETDIENLEKTAADFSMIENLLTGISARKKLMLLDTCESGEPDEEYMLRTQELFHSRGFVARNIFSDPASVSSPRRKAFGSERIRKYLLVKDRFIYSDIFRRTGSIILSSSRGGEASYEHPAYKNGLFTEAILNAFKGKADIDGDGFISTDELREYVFREVSERTKGLQNPGVDKDNLYQKFSLPVLKENVNI
ncbi:MAG: hypothetical protein H7A25_14145 [Leptospiraceae bacterium]|nr:hypothetical protein [Leptospiraceae bacterium]